MLMLRRYTLVVMGALLVATAACGRSETTYPDPVADGSVVFTRVKLPEAKGYEYAAVRVVEQTMEPEQVRLEWSYWHSSEQTIEGKSSASRVGVFTPSEPINVNLATLRWSGNRTGFGWFSTTPLIKGEVQDYATYLCVVPSAQEQSLIEAVSQCAFKARW